jgi:hypothetical protein
MNLLTSVIPSDRDNWRGITTADAVADSLRTARGWRAVLWVSESKTVYSLQEYATQKEADDESVRKFLELKGTV